MRNDAHGWFVCGMLIAIASATLPLLFGGPGYADGSPLLAAFCVMAFLIVGRFLLAFITFRIERRVRPHKLFTPLYDQR